MQVRTARRLAGLTAAMGLVAAATGCASSNSEQTPASGSPPAPTASYQPGTKSTAALHPPNPVITKMSYRTRDGQTSVLVPVTTQAGSAKDEVTATVTVYPNLNSRQRPAEPIYTSSVKVEAGDNKVVELPLSPEATAAVSAAAPGVADQLVAVSVVQKVDGDADGVAEGTLNSRSSYHDSQVSTAGETVNLTITTTVPGVNVATIPMLCMYNDSDSNFAPLTTTLSAAGDYVSASIEADGDAFESPQYGGPPWSQIASELTTDAGVDTARLILGALDPVNIAIQGILDIISVGVDDCDTQASIFQVTAAQQSSGNSTSQGYVASEQTSNGLLSAATAQAWQQNMQNQGGTVWQTGVSNQYLQQAANASVDAGLSIAATNQEVGTLTTSSSWTFTINEGGTSSIPNGCDDRGC